VDIAPAITPTTPTQLLLLWTLLGFLLLWMILFALLACRPGTSKPAELDELTISPMSLPATTAPATLQMIKTQTETYKPATTVDTQEPLALLERTQPS
jgi:hypothetical protein